MKKKNTQKLKAIITFFVIFFIFFGLVTGQQDTTKKSGDLYDMDLESLMNISVTTASKKIQNINDAPVAIYVITKEDLQFFGANNIGEALRMVPGIEIIQGGDQNYEVTVRGMSRSEYNTSNKILWLVDGRSVYNDELGGVRIESIPVSIDDIEKIEVIRGAGSSLYGANAFQGIINIITKKPEEQDGVYAKIAYGNLNQLNSNLRFGGKISKFSYKLTIGYDNIDKNEMRFSGLTQNTIDSLKNMGRVEGPITAMYNKYGNFMMNYQLKENSIIGLSGGFSDNYADHYFVLPAATKYSDFFTQINYTDSKNTFRVYFNGMLTDDGYFQEKFLKKTTPSDVNNPIDLYLLSKGRSKYSTFDRLLITNQMLDAEYQRLFQFGDKVNAILGGSYRKNMIEGNMLSQDAELVKKQEDLSALFTQIEYRPIEKLNFILGGRYDYHTVVGHNFNPRFATIYNLTSNQTIRLGFGTASRNPHLFNLYLNTDMKVANLQKLTGLSPVYNLTAGSDYIVTNVSGNKELKAEKITSYEIGYQVNFSNKVQCRFDIFYNQMTNPISFGPVSTIEAVNRIENIHQINSAFSTNLAALAPYNGGIDPTVPNEMTASEMQAQIDELNKLAGIIQGVDPVTAEQLKQMAAGLSQLQPLYGTPVLTHFESENSGDKYTYYGGEIGLLYVLNKNISIISNYAYLSFSDTYNKIKLDDSYHLYNETQFVTTIQDAEHKFNIGVKFQFKGIYFGTMFNYMSKETFPFDNNKNGKYDVDDRDKYENKGVYEIEARTNLAANLGFKFKAFDFFITGYNLIQDDYRQIPDAYATVGGDKLHTRYMGGIRVNF